MFQCLQVLIHFIIFLLKRMYFSRMFEFEAVNRNTIKFCFHGNIYFYSLLKLFKEVLFITDALLAII